MKDAFAIVYAGTGNPLLGDLIAHRCVGALPFAGRYRTIDVLLSNISQSGIRDVGVIMQRNFQSLIEHIGAGAAWDLNSKRGGVALLTPFDQGIATDMYGDFGDAIMAKRYYLDRQHGQYCLLVASDSIYRCDYSELIDRHIESEADVTMLYARGPRPDAADSYHQANLVLNDEGRVEGFDLDASAGAQGCFSLGAFVLSKELLLHLVEEAAAKGKYGLMTDIIGPALSDLRVMAVEHGGYSAHLTTVKSYFDLMQDMTDPAARDELFYAHGPVYTRIMDAPPVRFSKGCCVEGSVVGNGCDVRGRVVGSVLFRGISVEPGADVQNCVIMQDSHIGAGAYLRNVIIDKNVVVGEGVRLVGTPDSQIVVRKGSIVE